MAARKAPSSHELSREELLQRMALLDEQEYLERQLRLRQQHFSAPYSPTKRGGGEEEDILSTEEQEKSLVIETSNSHNNGMLISEQDSSSMEQDYVIPVKRPSSLYAIPSSPSRRPVVMQQRAETPMDIQDSSKRPVPKVNDTVRVLKRLITTDLQPVQAPWEKKKKGGAVNNTTKAVVPSKNSTLPLSALTSLGQLPKLGRVSSCVVVNFNPTTTAGSGEAGVDLVSPVGYGVMMHGLRGCLRIEGNLLGTGEVVHVTVQRIFYELWSASKYVDGVVQTATGICKEYIDNPEDVLWTRSFWITQQVTCCYMVEVHLEGLNLPLTVDLPHTSDVKEKVRLRSQISATAGVVTVSGCLQTLVVTF